MELKEQVKNRVKIEHVLDLLGNPVVIKKKGNYMMGEGPCGCGQKKKSTTQYSDDHIYCHACHESWDIFGLVKHYKKIDNFQDQINWIVDNFLLDDLKRNSFSFGSPDTQEERKAVGKSFVYKILFDYGRERLFKKENRQYLEYLINGRGYADQEKLIKTDWCLLPSKEICSDYLKQQYGRSELSEIEKDVLSSLTFAHQDSETQKWHNPENDLCIAWRDEKGKITGFARRRFNGEPERMAKWKYTKGIKKDNPLGIHRKSEAYYLVEGMPDTTYLYELGINAVAIGNGKTTERHIKYLPKDKVIVLAFDNDKTGIENTRATLDLLLDNGFNSHKIKVIPPVSISQLGGGAKDLDEFLRNMGEEVTQDFCSIAGGHGPLSIGDYLYRDVKEKTKDKPKADVAAAFAEASVKIKDPLQRKIFVSQFLELSWVKKIGIDNSDFEEASTKEKEREMAIERDRVFNDVRRKFSSVDVSKGNKNALEVLKNGIDAFSKTSQKRLEPYLANEFFEDCKKTTDSLKTGLRDLDKSISIPRGTTTIIAGLPGHGKTAFKINVMVNMVEQYPEKRFYFFSYEERSNKIALRFLQTILKQNAVNLCPYEGIDNSRESLETYLKEGRTDIEEIEQAKYKFREFTNSGRLNIISEKYDVEELRELVTLECETYEVGAVFVDYIQKIRTSNGADDMRLRITKVSEELLGMANDNGIHLLVGAQFGRDGKKSPGKPDLHHLRESSAIEDDAGLVLRVWNDSKTEREEGHGFDPSRATLEIKALKNREGANSLVEILFDMPLNYMHDTCSLPKELQ